MRSGNPSEGHKSLYVLSGRAWMHSKASRGCAGATGQRICADSCARPQTCDTELVCTPGLRDLNPASCTTKHADTTQRYVAWSYGLHAGTRARPTVRTGLPLRERRHC